MKTACWIAVSLCLPASVLAQAVVEAGVATAGSATAAGGAAGVGKSIGGVFNSLNRTLSKTKNNAETPSPGSPAKPEELAIAQPTQASEPRPEPPKREPIDTSAIKPGMSRTELIGMNGSPSLKITRNDGPAFLETMWYARPGQPDVVIRLKNGLVERVESSSN